MADSNAYPKDVTVAILPDGKPNRDPIRVAENGTVRWKSTSDDWEVKFDGGKKPVAGKGEFRGRAGQDDGGNVTAREGERFTYTISIIRAEETKRVDPEMEIGPRTDP